MALSKTDTEVTNSEASTCVQQPMYVIRDEIRNQPLYTLSNPIGPRNFVDGTIIPPSTYTAIPRTETQVVETGVGWPTVNQPNFHNMTVILGADLQPNGETEGLHPPMFKMYQKQSHELAPVM